MGMLLAHGSPGVAQIESNPCDAPPEDQPPNPPQPVEVCGTTVLKGSSGGFVRVRLPQETSFTTENQGSSGADIEMEGAGPFIGFGLIADDDGPDLDGPGVILGRYPPEAYPHRFVGAVLGPLEGCEPCTFPPGDYLLYLLASQPETTITLRFSGLSGSVELTPQTPVPFQARYQTIQLPDAGKTHYLAGGAGDLFSEGLAWTAVWAKVNTNIHQRWAVGLHYSEPSMYQPQCEGANQADQYTLNELNLQDPLGSREHGHGAIWRVNEPGRYAMCDWAFLLTNTEHVDSIGVWWSVWPLGSLPEQPSSRLDGVETATQLAAL